MTPRVSVGSMMVAVLMVAVDFAIVRTVWDWGTRITPALVVTLPMLNLLLLAFPKVRHGDPFWFAFEAGGFTAVFVMGMMAMTFDAFTFWPANLVWDRLQGLDDELAQAIVIAFAVVFYTALQLGPTLVYALGQARKARRSKAARPR